MKEYKYFRTDAIDPLVAVCERMIRDIPLVWREQIPRFILEVELGSLTSPDIIRITKLSRDQLAARFAMNWSVDGGHFLRVRRFDTKNENFRRTFYLNFFEAIASMLLQRLYLKTALGRVTHDTFLQDFGPYVLHTKQLASPDSRFEYIKAIEKTLRVQSP